MSKTYTVLLTTQRERGARRWMIYLMRESSSINGLKSLNHEAEITPLEIPLFYLSRSAFCRSIAAGLSGEPCIMQHRCQP